MTNDDLAVPKAEIRKPLNASVQRGIVRVTIAPGAMLRVIYT